MFLLGIRPIRSRVRFTASIAQFLVPVNQKPLPNIHRQFQLTHLRATFHSSPPRRDVFFFAFPTLKAHLLDLTRVALVALPFVYRYRLWKRYPKLSITLLQIPIFALCIVLALGLDQSPRTQRWRLLLMSEREEIEWARSRFNESLTEEGPLLLTAEDPRVAQVRRVTERLIAALEDQASPGHIVSSAVWPPLDPSGIDTASLRPKESIQSSFPPSATAASSLMPFRPESSNPTKILVDQDWKLYVVDLPKINAFALPTREIFIYTGLIELLEDDTLLSGVLAHEIAHVTQRHASEKAGFLNLAAVAFDMLRGVTFALTISFPFVTDATGSFLNWLNNYVAERAFSRKLEMEADAVGLEFMARAGYDPRIALDLWEIMATVDADGCPLLRTHPASSQRQKNIAKLLPRVMNFYHSSPFNPSRTSAGVSPRPQSEPKTATSPNVDAVSPVQ